MAIRELLPAMDPPFDFRFFEQLRQIVVSYAPHINIAILKCRVAVEISGDVAGNFAGIAGSDGRGASLQMKITIIAGVIGARVAVHEFRVGINVIRATAGKAAVIDIAVITMLTVAGSARRSLRYPRLPRRSRECNWRSSLVPLPVVYIAPP